MSTQAAFASQRKWMRIQSWPLTNSKFKRILELCRGKEVLDIGCVGGEPEADLEKTSHFQIAMVAKSCLGIDISEPGVDRWRKAGYEARLENAETFELARQFDVIVAADLIEHLSSPGAFLDRAREHLRPGGLLCVVTPNALSLNNALKSIAGINVSVNPEHTCWFDLATLRQILRRHGFHSVEEYWQDYQAHPLTQVVLRLRRNLASHLILVAERLDGGLR